MSNIKNKKASESEPKIKTPLQSTGVLFRKKTARLNRKGMSDIVVNLILIVVSLAAVTMTASFVLPLMQNADIQTSPEYSCIALQTLANPELEITRACINQENQIELDITRSALNNIEIQGLVFQLETSTFSCGNSCSEGECIIQSPGSKKTYFFELENESPETIKIFLNSCQLAEAPIKDC